jgi:hypothetical protein
MLPRHFNEILVHLLVFLGTLFAYFLAGIKSPFYETCFQNFKYRGKSQTNFYWLVFLTGKAMYNLFSVCLSPFMWSGDS